MQAFAGMFSVNGRPMRRRRGWACRCSTSAPASGRRWAASPRCKRGTTGQGCIVDTSLFETGLGWMAQHFAGFNESGRQPPRHRTGNPKLIVFQAFDTADGEIVVAAANDRLFAKFAVVLGHPEWGSDPRFRTNADRIAHREILLPLLEAAMRRAAARPGATRWKPPASPARRSTTWPR